VATTYSFAFLHRSCVLWDRCAQSQSQSPRVAASSSQPARRPDTRRPPDQSPPAAAKAQALAACIAFANKLDTARLRAARQGAAAYKREIDTEKSAASDPSIAARDAAGFSQSCNAR